MAQCDFQVTSNDISEWSAVFGQCYLKNTQPAARYQALIDHLNAVQGDDGWFTQHYGGLDFDGSAIQPDGSKKPWQQHNTRKLDGIRTEIDTLNLSETDRAVALTSLMLAMDEVDNTLGHFTSYLKDWSPRSYKTMHLKVPKLFENKQENTVLKGDEAGHFIAVKAIEKLIASVDAKYVALSYSSGGKATAHELNDILCRHGKLIKTIELDYRKNVMAEMKWTNEWLRDAEQPNREFIFLIEK